MNSANTKLLIFPFPQFLTVRENGESDLTCNIMVLPRFNPLNPIAGVSSFAAADLQLQAFLVKGNEQLPSLDDHDASYFPVNTAIGKSNDRSDLFTKVAGFFTIDDDHRREFTPSEVKKYLPPPYQEIVGNKPATKGAVTDNSYFCELKKSEFQTPYVKDETVNWSHVMAFCIQQPLLAEKLGLLFRNIKLPLPSNDFFKEGGWLYVDLLEAPDPTRSLHTLAVDKVQRYAARIPKATETRQVFSAVLFPVEPAGTATENFDEVFDEAVRYDDGFAKLVHTSQATSNNHMDEGEQTTGPTMDLGIRMGWDDEQILDWMNRGMKSMAQVSTGIRDTPLSVSRYRIDVASVGKTDSLDPSNYPEEQELVWKSQVAVSTGNLVLDNVQLGQFKGELGVEVAPVKHTDKAEPFWLPSYFAFWNGTSLCADDPFIDELNQLELYKAGMGNTKAVLYKQEPDSLVNLKYGNTYAVRVRLSDLSGGGPDSKTSSINKGINKISFLPFKRFVTPQAPILAQNENGTKLTIKRPRLNYPAILFTEENSDTARKELLKDRSKLNDLYKKNTVETTKLSSREVGLPDPDIDRIEIIIEVKSLEMDREDSYNGIERLNPKEQYVFLYKTTRTFPAYKLHHSPSGDHIKLNLRFEHVPVIQFNRGLSPNSLSFNHDLLKNSGSLWLPSGREVRLTIRSMCGKVDDHYFGGNTSRYSIPVYHIVRKDPTVLESLPLLHDPADGSIPLVSYFFRGKAELTRLATNTGLLLKGRSLSGQPNVRTQFGCSRLLGHTLSPDHSSITFMAEEDFGGKWINVVQLDLNRDWTWDLLNPSSFEVIRQWRYEGADDFGPKEELGGIYLTKGLNWQVMTDPERNFTRLIFIDAFDPKPAIDELPRPIELLYKVVPSLKSPLEGIEKNLDIIRLPITTPPSQVPRIVSVGIAETEDDSEESLFESRYAETHERRRYLWIEFAEPLTDPIDNYFARMLGYAPDPMLAAIESDDGQSEQEDPPISLEAEWIRTIMPKQPTDQAGLNAMYALLPAKVEDGELARHFLLPLPSGYYPESNELFGFFTFEFRVGHASRENWSTAQGRFGQPIRVTGIQFPAPPMRVSTMREKDNLLVNTSHAQSYNNGKDCTPIIPRTDIYVLLYAQVLQADGLQYRNILIDQMLLMKPRFTTDQHELDAYKHREEERHRPDIHFTPPEPPLLYPGSTPYAIGFWNMKEVRDRLRFLGLDINASLSVLTVELMPPNYHPELLHPEQNEPRMIDAQDLSIEHIRVLRTSRLCRVMESCPVE